MAVRRKKKRSPKKTYRFQLSLPGIAGIAVVCFCLFLWMFLLGIWAGQTFLLPSARPGVETASGKSGGGDRQVETLVSRAKKKPSGNGQE
jgi:hypothetical protein